VAGVTFSKIANEMLPGWDISLVFISPAKARALNKQLRGKTYTPNVLSYKLGEKSGEIFICPAEAAKQAPSFCLPPTAYCLLLFIHGLLHLKGWAHSAKMEKCERKLLVKFAHTNVATNSHRH
jgi:rRNA maturation RNase YbeY